MNKQPTGAVRSGSLRADARRNRERVLEAAEEAFAEDGLGVSTEEVARRAGVGTGTLFRHFPTKQVLIEALAEVQLARIIQRAGDAAAESDPAALPRFLRHFVTLHSRYRSVGQVLSGHQSPSAPLMRQIAALHEELDRLIRQGKAAGTLRPDLTVIDLLTAMAACAHVADHASGTVAHKRFIEIVLDGLNPVAPTKLPKLPG
jgi:AcrR family transcriptional regulator